MRHIWTFAKQYPLLLGIVFIPWEIPVVMLLAFLLTTFLGTCSTFLTTAWIFEKNKIKIDIKTTNPKSFYYSVGLIEGTETILFFVLMFLFYEFAYLLAWILSFLCIITSLLRILNVKFVLNAKK